MDVYNEQLVARMNAIAHEYGPRIKSEVLSVLSSPKYRNTGAGVDSVKVTVIDGNASQSPDIKIEFADHLGILNRSKLQWTKLPDMKELLAWAETKKNSSREANALAWGTAKKQLKFDAWKPKLWRKKSLSEVLKQMNKEIVAKWETAAEEVIVETYNKTIDG